VTQAELKRYLVEVHDRTVNDGCRLMTVDMRGLQFVDSSAIRLFVDWISRATEAGYKIVFLVDSAMTWQRLSFSVLKSMAPATIEIRETDSGAPNSEPKP
jgi:anti-anti-sigma factor